MQTKLTVLVPGIRTANCFISPYDLPEDLKKFKNVRLINDWGTPMRCQQIGLTEAKGDYITWAADDGTFLPNALDVGFKKLGDYKTVVMGKYTESEKFDKSMLTNEYYILNNHDASKNIPDNCWMLNVGLVSRKLLLEVGGWDCQFEVCPMAYNDLAIRLQNYGCKFVIQNELMFKCSHMPGHTGDHAPIHDGQVLHDQPLFNDIYSSPDARERVFIDLDNWKKSPEKWSRRFA